MRFRFDSDLIHAKDGATQRHNRATRQHDGTQPATQPMAQPMERWNLEDRFVNGQICKWTDLKKYRDP